MARETRSLLDLRTQAREDAKLEQSGFVSDAEIDRKIMRSISVLYAQAAGSSNVYDIVGKSAVVSGVSPLSLPADFYSVHMLLHPDGSYRSVPMLRTEDRPHAQEDVGNLTFTLEYYPVAPALTVDADEWSFLPGWGDYVAADVAARLLEMEESDSSSLIVRRESALQAVLRHASLSHQVETRGVRDVRATRASGTRGWLTQDNFAYRLDAAGIRIFRYIS